MTRTMATLFRPGMRPDWRGAITRVTVTEPEWRENGTATGRSVYQMRPLRADMERAIALLDPFQPHAAHVDG